METCLHTFFISCCFILLLLPSFLISQEVEDESEFSYVEESKNGPAKWGQIRPEWRNCSTGKMQSPIDLMKDRIEEESYSENLHTDYRSNNATLINRGHDIMLRWANGAGYMYDNGVPYQLKQLHWHVPSEHSISGKRFDMEMHLVHETSDGKIAVIAIMYRIGKPDSFLSMLENDLKAIGDTKEMEKEIGNIDPFQIKKKSRKYYRCIGSLTVPPCSENVIWRIIKKVKTVSKYQVKLHRRAIHDGSKSNARPIQPLNGRIVRMYKNKFNQDFNKFGSLIKSGIEGQLHK